MIVGFKIKIIRMEGKWKLNQNHSVVRRKKLIELRSLADSNFDKIAEFMEQTISDKQ